jgi:structural maintenance of chromosome 4
LGDLGIIDDKYDVAISTACPQLDQIVVEDVETAQKCIQHLREKNLGRASFIVLNKMNTVDSTAFSSPEDAPRLFDLVRPKEARFATAFYFALQNTLVAKDLVQANRIAYGKQRWRVVTLDGQLIDKSGTMSGGGNRVIRGLMSSKFTSDGMSDKEIEQLEASREGEESRLRQLVAIRKEMEGEVEKLTAEIPKIEVLASKLEMEIKSARAQVADFDEQIADLRYEAFFEVTNCCKRSETR